ncbi:hypothetical protein VTK26DRAFT_7469 [Humicola hyalothermophila]
MKYLVVPGQFKDGSLFGPNFFAQSEKTTGTMQLRIPGKPQQPQLFPALGCDVPPVLCFLFSKTLSGPASPKARTQLRTSAAANCCQFAGLQLSQSNPRVDVAASTPRSVPDPSVRIARASSICSKRAQQSDENWELHDPGQNGVRQMRSGPKRCLVLGASCMQANGTLLRLIRAKPM